MALIIVAAWLRPVQVLKACGHPALHGRLRMGGAGLGGLRELLQHLDECERMDLFHFQGRVLQCVDGWMGYKERGR